ncbi:MAG: glycerol-3-phosphate dehydrogenase/oxidase [Saprospiraceae bacterium]|jgi:glycerol-3-phosphate dehydrogenase|nr:glycerol-3-phosphate dehydrogenase/oxidase [Saprospiraceae bacterium]
MNRDNQLHQIENTTLWDIVVIGGGATGLGSALDAASRGYKVLCVEKTDFSKGTSSRSTKLIHGGVRYLEQGNFSMVKHALQERWVLLNNASEATKKLSFVLPVYSWWQFFYYGLGLMLYDFLSGKFSIGKTRLMNKESVLKKIPDLHTDSLKGGIRYFDGQFDDSQICIALARTAISQGATVVNHMAAESFIYQDNKISGLNLRDTLINKPYTVHCKTTINATGVFVDKVMNKDTPHHESLVSPSQGIHIVIHKKFYMSQHAMLIPKTTDGRVLFAVPWHDQVIIGTTDSKTDLILEEPVATKEEINFVIENFNSYMTHHLTLHDIQSVYAGLRPLVKKKNITSTADLVRDHTIVVSDSGLVTITGGKWTTYRKMARDVVNRAIRTSSLHYERSQTKSLHLIIKTNEDTTNQSVIIHPDFPYTTSDVHFAIDEEMACTLEDILARRVRLLFLDAKAAMKVAPDVCKILQTRFNHSDEWYKSELETFYLTAKKYLPENIV